MDQKLLQGICQMRLSSHCRLIVFFALLSLPVNCLGAQDVGAAFQPVKTKLLRGGDKAQTVTVDVTGVKDLYLVVTFGGDNYRSDQAIWGRPTLIDANGNSVDLTTVEPKRARVGWGRLYVNENQKSQPLEIAGQTVGSGFWAAAVERRSRSRGMQVSDPDRRGGGVLERRTIGGENVWRTGQVCTALLGVGEVGQLQTSEAMSS
jgi:hypothetical protein